jgi:OOP family OmpA-OmpF porin
MATHTETNPSTTKKSHAVREGDESWNRLRTLVVGREQERLEKIEARLDDPEHLAEEISNVLPDAVGKTSKKSEALVRAFTPVVEKSVHESVKKSAKTFANLLYPVIRPAIQKAIANTFKRMIQSFNMAIENSFSLKGLRWRMQSIITRKPFAEVVLLHSLVYSVDQVFLIRKESGILLHQVQSALSIGQDGDLVSSMLKAIQDFVQDSFKLQEEELEIIQVGDFSIWIEQGEFAILAGVVRGNAPEEFRNQLKNALEKIEHEFRGEFDHFRGETAPFEKAGYLLEPCLQTKVKERKKRVPLLSWLLLLAILGYSGYAIYNSIEARQRWTAFLEQVETIPGVTVTETDRKSGKYVIKGMRDPLSPDPMKLLPQFQLKPAEVSGQWSYYQSLLPQYILKRAKTILAPPASVQITFKDGIIYAGGSATSEWKKEADILARAIAGVKEFRQTDVLNLDIQDFGSLVRQVSTQRFGFELGKAELLPGQEENLEAFVKHLHTMLAKADQLNRNVKIMIYGHTDSTGTESLNERIRIARAEYLFQFLTSRGIPGSYLSAVSMDTPPELPEGEIQLSDENRRVVSFTVIVDVTKPGSNSP